MLFYPGCECTCVFYLIDYFGQEKLLVHSLWIPLTSTLKARNSILL